MAHAKRCWRALRHCEEVPLGGVLARAAGLLCGQAGTASTLARSDDTLVFTSDPNDIAHLADTLGASIRLELI